MIRQQIPLVGQADHFNLFVIAQVRLFQVLTENAVYLKAISAGAVLKHPVQSFDIVEISRTVVEGAQFFNHINGKPLADRRSRLLVADAKEVFNLQPETRYDVIISQPSNPWMAAIANLFSIEFFSKAAVAHSTSAYWIWKKRRRLSSA